MNVPNPKPSGDVHGLLKGVSLINFLQLIEMGGDTCLLEIHRVPSGDIGRLFINKGNLYDAQTETLSGNDAAVQILKWDPVEISTQNWHEKHKTKKIDNSLLSIIFMAQSNEDASTHSGNKTSQRLDPVINSEKEIYLDINSFTAQTKQEVAMDVQKLNETVEILKRDLGDGLLATDIFGAADGQSVAGFNPQPKASALFNKLTDFINESLDGSGFPALGKYYLVDLVDGNMVVVIPMGSYRWGMLVDTNKTQMGLLLNIVIPKIIDAFEEVITS